MACIHEALRHTSKPRRTFNVGRRASITAFLRWSVRNENYRGFSLFSASPNAPNTSSTPQNTRSTSGSCGRFRIKTGRPRSRATSSLGSVELLPLFLLTSTSILRCSNN
ncbi:DUF1534 domain-containing protein [Pseudomonas syringae]|nr:DUF1534 domain-containing protein [Pseudomonas syringae]MCF5481466.1 DUF1534 domain-containing protein [Pseudomonas syringae]MCF5492340.1 DUF1534 domain-containing protein [Pseudomonas syringae]MCF5501255.1 DUF1534 domain-containing protein [Pseudomonas syringae]MCF5533784.1 DUF1534 domain-containing protein [Pseudomonas syringae]